MKQTTKKRVKYKDTWVLNNGLYEIHWKNDVAVEVAVEGIIFRASLPDKKKRV